MKYYTARKMNKPHMNRSKPPPPKNTNYPIYLKFREAKLRYVIRLCVLLIKLVGVISVKLTLAVTGGEGRGHWPGRGAPGVGVCFWLQLVVSWAFASW